MSRKIKVCVFFILFAGFSVQALSNPRCHYVLIGGRLSCQLSIDNPQGFDNFTGIDGQLMPGKSHLDVYEVRFVEGTTKNIPSIICDTFINAHTLFMFNAGIEEISSNCLRHCSQVESFQLNDNKISSIAKDAFINMQELSMLWMNRNLIKELPQGVFSPLTALRFLYVADNKIEAIHSSWFSKHQTNIHLLDFRGNKVDAVDEGISEVLLSDSIGLNLFGNVCADGTFSRPWNGLEKCFDNFKRLENEKN